MVLVRAAITADIPAVVALGQEMFALSTFAQFTSYDAASVVATLDSLMVFKDGCVLVADDAGQVEGFVCALITPLYCNQAVRVLSELAWFVAPSKRKAGLGGMLMIGIEQWAAVHQVDVLHLSTLASAPEVGAWYCARGFIPHEANYVRRVSCQLCQP